MFAIIGWVVVVISVIGGYVLNNGHLAVLWQPFEVMIIVGAAVGAFITGNPKVVIGRFPKEVGHLLKGVKYNKDSYLELLTLLYQIFKIAKTKGLLALEQHIEKPEESPLFQQFPKFYGDHHAMVFLCDYLRLMSLGSDNAHELGDLLDEELETHHKELLQVADAVQTMADGMPALGIVAAVLGVIHTMGSITEPPEVLGHLIGGALVGTFMGVLLSYGFIAPISSGLKGIYEAEGKYFQCMKVGLLAHLGGYAPTISVEYARKTLMSDVRPTFFEVEEATAALPPA
ncbi:MAG: flagellar motor stator protein MotA [Azospirillum sp.]|nr:flagellar motor stator protein MotA [Azospirillum sp.]